jgi:hypothetical protein
MQAGRLTSQKLHEETNQRPTMYPFHCGSLFEICCCCCEDVFYKTDAIDYYTDCEKDLRDKLAVAKELAYNSPLGIAFVTFKNEAMASRYFFILNMQVNVLSTFQFVFYLFEAF